MRAQVLADDWGDDCHSLTVPKPAKSTSLDSQELLSGSSVSWLLGELFGPAVRSLWV